MNRFLAESLSCYMTSFTILFGGMFIVAGCNNSPATRTPVTTETYNSDSVVSRNYITLGSLLDSGNHSAAMQLIEFNCENDHSLTGPTFCEYYRYRCFLLAGDLESAKHHLLEALELTRDSTNRSGISSSNLLEDLDFINGQLK